MREPGEEQTAQWYPRLFRTALRMTGRPEDAADLAQEAICKALSAWHQFDGKALPTTWLHRILVNCVKNWLRTRSTRSETVVDEWDIVPCRDGSGEILGHLEKNEELAALRRVINGLRPKLRHAFVGAVLDGYSYAELADRLGIPEGTVASRVSAARKHVFAAVQEAFPEV